MYDEESLFRCMRFEQRADVLGRLAGYETEIDRRACGRRDRIRGERAHVASADSPHVERGQHDALHERCIAGLARAELQLLAQRGIGSGYAGNRLALGAADRTHVVVKMLDENSAVR